MEVFGFKTGCQKSNFFHNSRKKNLMKREVGNDKGNEVR